MPLSIWTVYRNPSDYPGQFVARRFELDKPTTDVITGATLDEVRAKLPAGLACLTRSPGDEPHVVESWL